MSWASSRAPSVAAWMKLAAAAWMKLGNYQGPVWLLGAHSYIWALDHRHSIRGTFDPHWKNACGLIWQGVQVLRFSAWGSKGLAKWDSGAAHALQVETPIALQAA
eukprot:scaffold233203_cov22-Tisochrysis_lutea.AAC.1